jgi:hypothetical protein
MSKIIQISKAGWLKMFTHDHSPSYFMNLNQYEMIKKGEHHPGDLSEDTQQPFYIEFIRPGEQTGVRITFPSVTDRDEIFNGLVDAL